MANQLNRILYAGLMAMTVATTSNAAPITDLVVFGDSLSDVGNLFLAAGTPSEPYFEGRFSDGPIYAEYLNQFLGLGSLSPSLVGGDNYAWAGARAGYDVPMGVGAIPGLQSQVNQYLMQLDPAPDLASTLHLVFIGGNDIADALNNGFDLSTATAFLHNSAQNVVDGIHAIAQTASTQFLLPDVPDLSLTPLYFGIDSAHVYTEIYNQTLKQLILEQSPGIDIKYFNTSAWIDSISNQFSNTTEPCLSQNGLCQDPNNYLFFDQFHPSTRAHEAFAQNLLTTIDAPPTWVLLALFAPLLMLNRNRLLMSKALKQPAVI